MKLGIGMRCCWTCRHFRTWTRGEGLCSKRFEEAWWDTRGDDTEWKRLVLWAAKWGVEHRRGAFDRCLEWSGFAREDAEAEGRGVAGELAAGLYDAAVALIRNTECVAEDALGEPVCGVTATIRVEPGSVPVLGVELERMVLGDEQ